MDKYNWALPVVTFLPLAGALVMMLLPKEEEQLHKAIALLTSLATLAVGEGPQNAGVLRNMARLLKDFPSPVLNNAPGLIARLLRDKVSEMLQDIPGLVTPLTRRVTRQMLRLSTACPSLLLSTMHFSSA